MFVQTELVVLTVLVSYIVYSLMAQRLAAYSLTLPIVFVAVGFCLSDPLQSQLSAELLGDGKRLLAEVTLVLVLFSDASKVRFRELEKFWGLPVRMLFIGMPLTILFGTTAIYWIDPALGVPMALLTAAILTPTDAALGQQVIASDRVPERLKETINVESGLNDGLAFPFVLLGAALVASAGDVSGAGLAVTAVFQVLLGLGSGIFMGYCVARMMDVAMRHRWLDEATGGVVFLCTAFATYVLAEILGGNGFVAAFVGGAVFGNTYRASQHFISEFMEGAGQMMTMSAFLVFGALLLPEGLAQLSLSAVAIAGFMLTVGRVLPIYVSLLGSGASHRDKLFLGWFGPRGLASVLFTLVVLDGYDLAISDTLLACVTITVTVSVVLHGLTAGPLMRLMTRGN